MLRKKKIWFIVIIFVIYFLSNHYKNPITNYGIFYEEIGNKHPNLIERFVGNIPEIYQIKAITTLAPFYHGMFTKEEANRFWEVSFPVYNQIREDKKWSNLPSSLGNSYLSILHLSPEQNQYFIYIPKHSDNEKLPVLLLLHGFGGNYISFIYNLSLLADKYHIAVLAPSYKSGVWDTNSIYFINNVINDAQSKFDIDPKSYYLMGFSNGGLIVPEVYKKSPERYKGIILLSTYLDKNISFSKNMKVLVIQGSKDERIDPSNTREIVSKLKNENIDINLKEFPSDHFVFFENSNEILDIIGRTYFNLSVTSSKL